MPHGLHATTCNSLPLQVDSFPSWLAKRNRQVTVIASSYSTRVSKPRSATRPSKRVLPGRQSTSSVTEPGSLRPVILHWQAIVVGLSKADNNIYTNVHYVKRRNAHNSGHTLHHNHTSARSPSPFCSSLARFSHGLDGLRKQRQESMIKRPVGDGLQTVLWDCDIKLTNQLFNLVIPVCDEGSCDELPG